MVDRVASPVSIHVIEGRAVAVPMPGSRLEALFVAQAARSPGASAISFRGAEMSYGTLDAWSNGIARRLKSYGIGPGIIVGVCLNRSPAMIAVMLAVLKAGGAYLPLDPAYPAERLQTMVTDGAPTLVIVDSNLPSGLMWNGALATLGEVCPTSHAIATEPLPIPGTGDDLAYVIYTSGSTGRPKGVMLSHSAVRLVRWMAEAMEAGDIARVAATTSICFDPSVIEIFGTLGTGGTIILKMNALEPFLEIERPTMLAAPPPVLSRLAEVGAIPDSVRTIISGGEALTSELVRRLHSVTSVCRIYNHYGPTEATTCATVALMNPCDVSDPSIGRSIAGAEIVLVDPEGRPVGPGEIGEICIGGANLAIGYSNDPVATKARFRSHPDRPGERVYHTGDLGELGYDGRLWFRGRQDTQIKIRGFRVELGDIEAALLRLADVREAAVIARRDRRGRVTLTAFVVADVRFDLAELRRRLSAILPLYMLPAKLVFLDQIPLGVAGKTDRARLEELQMRDVQEKVGSLSSGTQLNQSVGFEDDALARSIAEVFARHLDLPDVSINDDFFDLGGDSLSAIDVAIEIESLTGARASAALLGQNGTPRELAAAIADLEAVDDTIITPLQIQGAGDSIFCVAELTGRPVSYIGVARRFAGIRPVIGLAAGRSHPSAPSLRALSYRYLEAIKTRRPHGPYIISGYSFAASQAFDLACLCEQMGEQVSLVLIDGPLFNQSVTVRQVARWIRGEVALCGARAALNELRRTWPTWSRLPRIGRRTVALGTVPRFVPKTGRPFARWLMQATMDYKAEVFHGPSILIRSTKPPSLFRLLDSDLHLGWKRLLPKVKISFIEGTHHNMVQEPSVEQLRDLIEKYLDDRVCRDAEVMGVYEDSSDLVCLHAVSCA